MSQDLDLHLLVCNNQFVYGIYLPLFPNAIFTFDCGQRKNVKDDMHTGYLEFANQDSSVFVRVPFYLEDIRCGDVPPTLDEELNVREISEIAALGLQLLDVQSNHCLPAMGERYPGLMECVRVSAVALTHPMSYRNEYLLDADQIGTFFSHYFPGGINPRTTDCLGELQYRHGRFLRELEREEREEARKAPQVPA